MQDLINEDGIGIRFDYSGGVILVLESSDNDDDDDNDNDDDDDNDNDDDDDKEFYLGKVSLEKDGSYTATPYNEYKYGTVWEDECKPQEGFLNAWYAALYLTSVASIHCEYSSVTDDNVNFIKSLIRNNFK